MGPCLQEISFFEQGEPIVDGDPGDLKVPCHLLRSRLGHSDLIFRPFEFLNLCWLP